MAPYSKPRTVRAIVVDSKLAVRAERSAGHERPARDDACIADQVAAGRVVCCIHNHIICRRQLLRICRCESLPVHVHLADPLYTQFLAP